MTSSPVWGRSPDADARMSRHGNAAQGAVEVARGDVHVGDATEGPGTCRNRGRTGAERSAIAGTTGAAVAARTTGSAGARGYASRGRSAVAAVGAGGRDSGVRGKGVSVRVEFGGRRTSKKK